ncbi:hypothetical protein MBAV_005566 [Candidatus Magnetobacterium bavaricum]|uniref:Uncharacterized protein n=1 Tax=Candidatus Magnetobacterium bavaricum TaxID=29290 RepID=A0A0F3GK11_9BACT|nr:hypothetical protein MBAV_005566 [Candidatus Magnetobacterium bavaricum]
MRFCNRPLLLCICTGALLRCRLRQRLPSCRSISPLTLRRLLSHPGRLRQSCLCRYYQHCP